MKPIVPEIFTFVLGSLENNSYLLVDPQSFEGVVIDPSFDSKSCLPMRIKGESNCAWCC